RLGKEETIVLVMAPALYVLGVGGMIHPSAGLITGRPTDLEAQRGISNKRIGIMALTLIIPPALAFFFILDKGYEDVMLPAFGTLLLAPLVLVRLARLVRDREHFAEQESVLRQVSEELVVARTTDDITDSVSRGASMLLGQRLAALELQVPARSLGLPTKPNSKTIGDLVAESAGSGTLRSGTLVPLDESDNQFSGLIMVGDSLKGLLLVEITNRLDDHLSNALSTLCRETAIALRAVDQVERSVRERSEARFESLIANSSDILAVLNAELKLVYVSSVAERLLGFPLSTLSLSELTEIQHSKVGETGRSGTVLDLIHPDDRFIATKWLASVAADRHDPIELRVQHFAGGYSWFEFIGTDLSHDPNVCGLVLNVREINDRKEAEALLQVSEARFKALVQNSGDLVVVIDSDRRIAYASPSVLKLTGLNHEAILRADFNSVFIDNDLPSDTFSEAFSTTSGEVIEFHFTGPQGRQYLVESTISDLRDQPAIGGFVLNARDVTDRRAMERKILYQASHDEVTGLPNRANALQKLTTILDKSSGATTVALLLIDIDALKDVNDSLGHEVGDELLVEMAERLTSSLTFGDIAARISGDEFAIIVERAHGEDQIMDLAYQLLDDVSMPFTIRGQEISVSVSAGIAFDHTREHTAEVMLRNADTAMYRAKDQGQNEVAVFEPHMHTATFDRLQLRADLARAVAHNQFEAYYQPIVDLDTSRIIGAEALVRWRHPQRGMVGPNLFIPLAEETGLISAIGEWMIEKATHDLAAWLIDYSESMEKFTVSVNLSPQQLKNANLVDCVTHLLRDAGLPPERLVLEITESTLVTEASGAVSMMKALRDTGIRLSIDDFGTGYSSLGYIQQFDFDVLKIDKSFVDNVAKGTNRRIVQTIMDLARNLEVKTVAEGIEEMDQVEVLRSLACPYGQGYIYSRPVPESDFRRLLETQVLTPVGPG
ncbi:MAG: EAL domain-containing protein, partial [Microthrixaceae bacterium]|nr:EAL domain-containing protein [Microthrixaceae bacterium]